MNYSIVQIDAYNNESIYYKGLVIAHQFMRIEIWNKEFDKLFFLHLYFKRMRKESSPHLYIKNK